MTPQEAARAKGEADRLKAAKRGYVNTLAATKGMSKRERLAYYTALQGRSESVEESMSEIIEGRDLAAVEKKAADAYERAMDAWEAAARKSDPQAAGLKKKAQAAQKAWRKAWDRLQDERDPYDESAKAHYRAMMQRRRVAPIDPDEYPPIKGMEGPFRFRSGRVLYYDPKAGRYYDRKSDLYMSRDTDPMQESLDWKRAAKQLLKQRTGTQRIDLGYRAYLRAIIDGQPASHLIKIDGDLGEGATLARQRLIDLVGKGFREQFEICEKCGGSRDTSRGSPHSRTYPWEE